jgi:hypothetical protein
MTFTAAGTLASNAAAALTTLAHTNVTTGNVLLLGTKVSSAAITVSSVTGGGATGWVKVAGPFVDTGSPVRTQELWAGTVTATGAQTITVNFSSSNAGINTDLDVQEFASSLGAGAVWTADVSGTLTNGASTTVTYPTLAPVMSGTELYVGQSRTSGVTFSGLTAGFTGQTDVNGNFYIYGLAVTGSVSPTATVSASVASYASAVLLTDTPPTGGGGIPATPVRPGLSRLRHHHGARRQQMMMTFGSASNDFTVTAQLATATAVALGEDITATFNVEIDAAAQPATATGTALQAGGQNVQLATGTGAAQNAVAALGVNAGTATATGAAQQPAGHNAVVATGVGTAQPATIAVGGVTVLAAAFGIGEQTAGHNVVIATAVGAALQPSVQTSGSANAPAQIATGTGTAQQPTVAITTNAGTATSTGTAQAPKLAITVNTGLATATAAALQAAGPAVIVVRGFCTTSITGHVNGSSVSGKSGNSVNVGGKPGSSGVTDPRDGTTSVTGKKTLTGVT